MSMEPVPYFTYRQFLKKKFSKPVIRIPINGLLTCPNRDGTKGTNGCIFCENTSFSPVALSQNSPLEQLHASLLRRGNNNTLFIAYFQSYTNTYAPVDYLKKIYEPILSVPGIVGLAIGSRPDCFPPECIAYMAELNTKTYVSIEIGLQSASETTLERINRHHSVTDFIDTVYSLSQHGLEVVVHIILGLPGETESDMINTCKLIASLPISGVKLHQCMVIKNTKLAESFYKKEYIPLELPHYAHCVGTCIGYLRSDQYIHRIVADAQINTGLIAPLWSSNKTNSIMYIQQYMREHTLAQGIFHTV